MDCSDGNIFCVGNWGADHYFMGLQQISERGVSPCAWSVDLLPSTSKMVIVRMRKGEVGRGSVNLKSAAYK